MTTARATTLGAGGGTFEVTNGTLTHNGVIDGPGGLTKTGNATLELNAVNPYAGGTQVNAGMLIANVNGALGSGAVSVDGGATLRLTAASTWAAGRSSIGPATSTCTAPARSAMPR